MQSVEADKSTSGLHDAHVRSFAGGSPKTAYTGTMSALASWIWLSALLMVALLPRVWNLSDTAMWSDEMLTMMRVEKPLENSIDSILSVGNQTPLYYLSLRLLPEISPLSLRLPSVVFGLINIVLVFGMVTILYRDRTLALKMAALVAANPMHIILSRTARYYTILLAFAILSLLAYVLLVRGRRSLKIWLLFVFSSMLAYLLHYTALALLAAQFLGLMLLGRERREFFWRWCFAQGAALFPLLLWLALTFTSYSTPEYEYLTQESSWRDVPVTLFNMVMGFSGDWAWAVVPGLISAMIGLLSGTVYMWTERKKHPEFSMWVLLALLPITVLYVLSELVGMHYRDRYLLVALPAILLVMLWGWQRYGPNWSRAGFAVILLTSLTLTWQVFDTHEYQRTDWYGVTNYIADHVQPGDTVMIDRQVTYRLFEYYYPDKPTAPASPSALDNMIVLEDTPDMHETEAEAGRIWVIYRIRHEDLHRQGWTDDTDPFQPHLAPIADWMVEHQDHMTETAHYDGVTIYLMEN